jgi:hypothetical protein
MITLMVIVCGGLLLAGAVVVLVAASSAPLGYENGQGFFEGIEPRSPDLETGNVSCFSPDDNAPEGDEDGLGSYRDVELWPQEGVEPALTAHHASPHVHGAQ